MAEIPILATKEDFQDAISSVGSTVVFVDFSATWCDPCKRMDPVFQKLSEQFPQAKFYKVG